MPNTSLQTSSVSVREWALAGLAFLVVAADLGNKFWGAEASGQVTANQVTTLTSQVTSLTQSVSVAQVTASQVATLAGQVSGLNQSMQTLSDKIGALPRASDVTSLGIRVDKVETSTGDLQQKVAALRSEMDSIPHPMYRNPPR